MASCKGSAIAHSAAMIARLLVVGLCVGLCQKGLGVTFEKVEYLLLDQPAVSRIELLIYSLSWYLA